MHDEWWERPVCILCDYWWLLLILLLLGLAAYFTRPLWLPSIPVPTPAQATPTRVNQLGTGDVQITLLWNNYNDLDLWVTDPAGESINYTHTFSASGGILDVDANRACQQMTSQPVENVYWPTHKAPSGSFMVVVKYYTQCDYSIPAATDFTVRLLVNGKTTDYTGTIQQKDDSQTVVTFTFPSP